MNKILQFFLLPLILFSLSPVNSFSQIEDSLNNYNADSTDSNLTLLGHSNTKFYYFKNDSMLIFKSRTDAKKFIDTTSSSFPFRFDEIDFTKNTLVLFSYHGGDCHARFRYYSVNNEYSKIFTVCVDIIYGGCRAGGKFMTTWGLIPNLPADYSINFSARMVDREYK